MLLTVPERFSLMGILPEQDSYAELRMYMRLRMVLSPTSEEAEEYEIKNTARPDGSGMITWKSEAQTYSREIPIDDPTTTKIKQILNDLDRNKKLDANTYPLYEKFVVNYQNVA